MGIDFAAWRIVLGKMLARAGFGMRAKLIFLFVAIKVAPLVLLALLAWYHAAQLGEALRDRTVQLAGNAEKALSEAGKIAVDDAMVALDNSARENIERLSTDTANKVADFLYARDGDILTLASLPQNKEVFTAFVNSRVGRLVKQGRWELSEDKKSWRRIDLGEKEGAVSSSNAENDLNFSYRPPEPFDYESRPLFLEATFVSPAGKELLKVVTSPRIDAALKDVTQRKNTYAKAENYFSELAGLKPGEIYVSDVIGTYVPSKMIGMFTPDNAQKKGIAFAPEEHAFAGKENPLGKRFKGIVRWATPVADKNGKIKGYVTLALDHDHIMEFTDHIMPTASRYTELSDAYEGNYAFIWDYKGRSIVHPRHHSIAGYHPETGEPQVPWLEEQIYNKWQESGKPFADFIAEEPTFAEQSVKKKPAAELTKQGLVGLDCRYLNFAPQCTGWFDLTQNGGSGSFNILWSGLKKLTTAATIPYYTGHYGDSSRGFGFVAIGAGLEEFHRSATETGKSIDEIILHTTRELTDAVGNTQAVIKNSLQATAYSLGISTVLMIILVVCIAIWLASYFTGSITKIINGITRFRHGERNFRFHAPVKDEIGELCDSVDQMADTIVQNVVGKQVILDKDKRVIYANEEALRDMGKTMQEAEGMAFCDYCLAGNKNPVESLRRGEECAVCYNKATNVHYKCSAEEFQDKDGNCIGYIINATDVSDLVSKHNQIAMQHAFLDTIVSCSPDIIWYKGADGRYLAVSPRFVGLTNKSREEVIGARAEEVLSADMVEEGAHFERLCLEKGGAVQSERTLLFADGHTEEVDSVVTPVYTADGTFNGYLGVARDITARIQMERNLLKTQKDLEQAVKEANHANASKSTFLARMSHEIRTPMNAVLGLSNIIQRKLSAPVVPLAEVGTHAVQIETSARHLLGVINEILEISKIEVGKIELHHEVFDLNIFLNEVIGIFKPRCQEKQLDFEYHIDHFEHTAFAGDALRLRQVLINLLGNATKFTPEQGLVCLQVLNKGSLSGLTEVEFVVRDSGIGIASELIDTLFLPFEQGNNEITRKYGGTGLGLSISQGILKLMGSHIRVDSEKGKGSTFAFTLKLEEAETAQETSVEFDSSAFRGKRVLVIDDAEINRLIVVEMLGELGLELFEAEDGEQALSIFEQSPEGYFDIILMDIQMPKMNGYEAALAIRSLKRSDAESVPIVAFTANSFKDDIEKAFQAGMNAHLSKPVEYERLLATLIRFCA